MTRYARILCPIDRSPWAARALRYAAALGQQHGAQVTALTVRPSASLLGVWGEVEPDRRAAQDEATAAEVEKFVCEAAPGSAFRVLLAEGMVVPEILRVARDQGADLLVMGTHGAGSVERLLLGSVTERVLRRATIPVLAIPRDTHDAPPEAFTAILCAVDRSDASRRALDHGLALARGCRGRLVLGHVVEHIVNEDPQFAHHFDTEACFRELAPELKAFYGAMVPADARADCHIDVMLRFGKPGRHLLDMAREAAADLIVVGTASAPAMFGSTAHRVVREAEVPVLVVPPPP